MQLFKRYFISIFLFLVPFFLEASRGIYLSPTHTQSGVTFTAKGALFYCPKDSLQAYRLTFHEGADFCPKYSLDGKKIAFVSTAFGDPEILLLANGQEERLTFGFGKISAIVGWTSDDRILFSYNSSSQYPSTTLAKLNPTTLEIESLPFSNVSDLTEKGTLSLFTCFFEQPGAFGNYRGGGMRHLWLFDKKSSTAKEVPFTQKAERSQPTFYREGFLYLSDETGVRNLYYKDDQGEIALTTSSDFPVSSYSLFENSVVYAKGGDLYELDLETKTEQLLEIELVADSAPEKRVWMDFQQEFSKRSFLTKEPFLCNRVIALSPNGNYLLLRLRDRLALYSVEEMKWGPPLFPKKNYVDFSWNASTPLALYTDGEEMRIAFFHQEKLCSLSLGPQTHTTVNQSPDGRWAVTFDSSGCYRLIHLPSGNEQLLDRNESLTCSLKKRAYFSPDSEVVIYEKWNSDNTCQLYLYRMSNQKKIALTPPDIRAHSPTFDPGGNYLFFLKKEFLIAATSSDFPQVRNPISIGTPPLELAAAKICAIPLKQNLPSPFPFEKTQKFPTHFELQTTLPDGDELLLRSGIFYIIDRESARLSWLEQDFLNYSYKKEVLHDFSIATQQSRINAAVSSGKLYYGDPQHFIEIHLPKEGDWVDLIEERKQIFYDTLRLQRDFFYEKRPEWEALKTLYAPLLSRVLTRMDLDFLLKEMLSKLGSSHIFLSSEKPRNGRPLRTSTLDVQVKKERGGFRVKEVFENDSLFSLEMYQSGLQKGDLIVAVNGRSVVPARQIEELLLELENKEISLTVERNNRLIETSVFTISPRQKEALKYSHWVSHCRRLVQQKSEGKIGYIHIPSMDFKGYSYFINQFYKQTHKEALIIDVRYNVGGFTEPWILQKLFSHEWTYSSNKELPTPSQEVFYPKKQKIVFLCNQSTSSNGEILLASARKIANLPIIGSQTWGGGTGFVLLRGLMTDYSLITVPQLIKKDLETREPLIEGRGISVDYLIDNPPLSLDEQTDNQLLFALEFLLNPTKVNCP